MACSRLMFLAMLASASAHQYIRHSFKDDENKGYFSHLVINEENNKIFVGAVNNIYQLSPNLDKEVTVTTGPFLDNPKCLGSWGDQCTYERTLTNSYSKALVIDYDNKKLISCSNLYLGQCYKRDLANITKKDTDIPKPIVPNDELSSCIVFIANGPERYKALYVAATRSTVGLEAYRDLVPAMSTRNTTTFAYAVNNIESKSKKEMEAQQRDVFRVDYIYGFSSKAFNYFLTVQKENTELSANVKYVTRIVRLCQHDGSYYSYTEVPLECSFRGQTYNLVQAATLAKVGDDLGLSLGIKPRDEDALFVVFSSSQRSSKQPTNNSALCVYSIRTLETAFTQNIQACFKGIGNVGPAHFVAPDPCKKTNYTIRDDYCGSHEFNTPVEGTIPISADAALHYEDMLATAITVTVTHKYTVAIIGSSSGHIHKTIVESESSASEYERFTVSTENPVKAIERSSTEGQVYVMTDKQVYLIALHKCDRFKTCEDCKAAKDPYCGWCTLENKCTVRKGCPEYQEARRWLSYSSAADEQCTRIESIQPSEAQLLKSRTTRLEIMVTNFPQVPGQEYLCAFVTADDPDGQTTPASLSTGPGGQRLVECNTPPTNTLPKIPTGSDQIKMTLYIRVQGKNFVKAPFVFYDCQVHNSCSSCTHSAFACIWCLRRHRCVAQQEACGTNTTFIKDEGEDGRCPKIKRDSSEILVPNGTTQTVSLGAENLQSFQTQFRCKFLIEGVWHEESAVLVGNNRIECNSVLFSYQANSEILNVPFKILWNKSGREKALDNPLNIQVKMYKCQQMAGSCGECLTINSTFNCGWCNQENPSHKTCSIQSDCSPITKWLERTAPCPNPRITKVTPLKGPVEGGTRVTIQGVNLGKTFSDIQDGVTVAGIICRPIRSLYINSTRIICETEPSNSQQSGPVRVIVNHRYRNQSEQDFHYVTPWVSGLEPRAGPVSGGTKVKLRGEHLDAGTNMEIRVLGKRCTLLGRFPDKVFFETPDVADLPGNGRQRRGTGQMEVQVSIDKLQEVRMHDGTSPQFLYVPDPTISKVDPKRGIFSGGLNNRVMGTNLDAVQHPEILFRIHGEEYTGPCEVKSSQEMRCESPPIPAVKTGNTSQGCTPDCKPGLTVPFGFKMDGVQALLNYTDTKGKLVNFDFYPDPEFEPFGEMSVRPGGKDKLILNGKKMKPALTIADVVVRVGEGYCNVTSVSSTEINCDLPAPGQHGFNEKAEVRVEVGRNLSMLLGEVRYEEPSGVLTMPVIIGIAAGAGLILLLVIISAVCCTRYRRKLQESHKERRRMQTQMDMLEAKVAKECREAFAELQTDMTELTADLAGPQGIPFHDYRTFCMKVLFPNTPEHEHPIHMFQVEQGRRDSTEKGLRQFNQLLHNKTFLLLFIRTLEASKDFYVRERVKLASLIAVALQDRMEYFTDILKTLLGELIEKNMEGRNHPKLLLRRTESVAEKMLTNWFTFLLYKFLRECAGEPLFLLFRAIKQQLDKGPVDALTSEAKYSLREDKLIRQQIDYKTLTIHVLDPDIQYGQEAHPVKVLDCDSISQVKEKILDAIYKNAPFSSRADKDSLDLEWKMGERTHLILKDEDISTRTDGEFKRLNTLAHYKVTDGAVMALVPVQSNATYTSLSMTSSGSRHGLAAGDNSYYSRNSPSNTLSATKDMTLDGDGGGIRYYHLVKPHDETPKEGDRGSKMVSEIYLTRLLATKGTLQQYVDDLFETIFSTANRGSALPLAIKYMFDFLDDQALYHNIQDPDVVHTWKSNSLPLRFWVNVIKNPDFVFDIYKSPIVDVCLSVVAQIFMDSCSLTEHRLGKDSPSSKLLYAKDIPKYKQWVDRYYQDVKMMPQISDQDMNSTLAEESRLHSDEFSLKSALQQLYEYVNKYGDELLVNLEEDEFARNYRLAFKLEQVMMSMESDV